MRHPSFPLIVSFVGILACGSTESTESTQKAPSSSDAEPARAAIDESSRAEQSDSERRLGVEVALRRSPDVYSPRVEVTVKDGVAYLRGSVEDEAARRAAIDLAASAPGVDGVVDELEVFPFDAPNYRERVHAAFD